MNATKASAVHAIIPLAVLESLRAQDVPTPDGLDEYHADLTTKRLGMSHTVSKQIERYELMASRHARVDSGEVAGLLQLVARRKDRDLLFADAGRRAAERAARTVSPMARRTWHALPFGRRRFGEHLASRVLLRIFDLVLMHDGRTFIAEAKPGSIAEGAADRGACGFYGSAIAATLRAFTAFDGAVHHQDCRAAGAAVCRWSTNSPPLPTPHSEGTDQ